MSFIAYLASMCLCLHIMSFIFSTFSCITLYFHMVTFIFWILTCSNIQDSFLSCMFAHNTLHMQWDIYGKKAELAEATSIKETFVGNLSQFISLNLHVKSFICYCIFQWIKEHYGAVDYDCKISLFFFFVPRTCGKGFVKKCNLTLHERVHSGERPHVCSHCGKAFSQRSTLVIHER